MSGAKWNIITRQNRMKKPICLNKAITIICMHLLKTEARPAICPTPKETIMKPRMIMSFWSITDRCKRDMTG